MWESEIFKVGMIVNVFWVIVSLYLNHRWYKYTCRLNDEWADVCEEMCSEIEDYYTKGDENNGQPS